MTASSSNKSGYDALADAEVNYQQSLLAVRSAT